MGKNGLDKQRQGRKNAVVMMPGHDRGEEAREGKNCNKKAAAKKTEGKRQKTTQAKGRRKKPAEEIENEDSKGARSALRRWVKKAVKERSPVIADRLIRSTADGDLQSAAMALGLIEKKKKGGGDDDGQDGPSLAEQLMTGPTWEEVLEARRKSNEEGTATVAA